MFILLIVLPVIIIDQLTKYIVLKHFQPGESVAVMKNIFHLSLVLNKGVAFGLLAQSGSIFIWTLVIAATLALLVLACSGRLLHRQKATAAFLSLILAGALGNLIDRMRFGYVIDFLDFRIWPVFNLADSAITVGSILLLWQMLKHKAYAAPH